MKEIPEKLQAIPRATVSRDVAIYIKAGEDLRVDLVELPHFDTEKALSPLRLTQNHTGG